MEQAVPVRRVVRLSYFLLLEIEIPLYGRLHLLPAQLDGDRAWRLRVVIKQRAEVGPESAGSEDQRDGADVKEHVVRRVQEKTREDAVPLPLLRHVNLDELPRGHGEVLRPALDPVRVQLHGGADVRDLDGLQVALPPLAVFQ